jgi:hypothetical protein
MTTNFITIIGELPSIRTKFGTWITLDKVRELNAMPVMLQIGVIIKFLDTHNIYVNAYNNGYDIWIKGEPPESISPATFLYERWDGDTYLHRRDSQPTNQDGYYTNLINGLSDALKTADNYQLIINEHPF